MQPFKTLLLLSVSVPSLGQINVDLFNQNAMTEPVQTVNCTLENGSSTQCYQLKFYANAVSDDGTVNINVPCAGGPPAPGVSACLQAQPDDDLKLMHLIPVPGKNAMSKAFLDEANRFAAHFEQVQIQVD